MGIYARFKPPGYVTASSVIALAGFLNGYDTGSVGAVTVMPSFEATCGYLTPFMRGFTVSLIMLAGGMPAFFAGQLSHHYGHLRIIGVGSLVIAIGCLFECVAQGLPLFLVGRATSGFGQGMILSNAYVYICEIAPSARRGMVVSIPQFLTTLGVCLGYFSCYGSVHIQSSLSWRIPYIVQVVIAAGLAAGCKVLPDSPRWLVLHGRREDALRSIEKLGILRAEAEKDILRVPAAVVEAQKTSVVESLVLIFRHQYRERTLLSLFVLGMIQLSGIDGILYYAPLLFQQAGLPEQTAGFLASGLSAILMMIITIPAVLFADRWGRRTSLLTGGVILSASMISIGSLYASGSVQPTGAARWAVVVLIFVFALAFCASWAVCGKLYASEILPTKTRAHASCVAQGLGYFTNWLVAFTTPIFLSRSSYGPYFLYGGLVLTTVAVLALYMPETRGVPLESIEEAFQRPVLRSWMAQVRRLASAMVKRSESVSSGERGVAGGSRAASMGSVGSMGEGSEAAGETEVDGQRGMELKEMHVRPVTAV